MTTLGPGVRPSAAPRRPHWLRQLHTKFLVIVTIAYLVISLPGGWMLLNFMQQTDDANLTARIGNLAARTAGAIERHGAYEDPTLSYDLMAPLAADRAFLCAEFSQGETIVSALPAGQGCVDRQMGYELVLPTDDRGLRSLRVGFTDIELRDTRNLELMFGLAALTLAFLAVTLTAGLAYRTLIWQPLNRLTDAILQTAQTGQRRTIDWKSNDEIGLVVSAYNDMITQETQRERQLTDSYEQLRASENALNAVNQQLELRVETRTADLAEALRAADNANTSKTHFLWSMSHELRTPLNAIIGFSEMISQQVFGPVQPVRYREAADDILFSGRHLLSVINDLLDIARIEAGRETLDEEPVAVTSLFAEALRVVQPLAEERSVELSRRIEDDSLTLRVDATKAKQILLNLLSNAIKNTPDGGSVTLSVSHTLDGRVALSVADTGRGIAPEDQATVLEPFGRLEYDAAHLQKGTGLGLPLARKMAELHGGELQLESQVGAGTTVTIYLPQSRIVPRAADAAFAPQGAADQVPATSVG